jgi:PAS domain S-box-containing protein
MNRQSQAIHDQKNARPLIADSLILDTIMKQSSDSIYFKDRETRFIYVNRAKAEHHGVQDPADMIGKTDFDFIIRSNAEEIYQSEKQIMETGQPIIGLVEKLNRIDGRTTWASVSKSPLYDAICSRIYAACEKHRNSDNKIFSLSISLGHATKTIADQSMYNTLKDAEDRMYSHKLAECNSVYRSMVN